MTRLSLLFAAIVFSTTGCNKSPSGGQTETKNSFTISGPSLTTTVEKGGQPAEIDLRLKPDENFAQTVKFETNEVEGLSFEMKPSILHPDDAKDLKLMVSAANQANVGEKVIRVTATPETGQAVSIDVKVDVVTPQKN